MTKKIAKTPEDESEVDPLADPEPEEEQHEPPGDEEKSASTTLKAP